MVLYASTSRRGTLAAAALALGVLLSGMPGQAHAQDETVQLTVSLLTPPASDLNKQFRRIQQALDEETGGRIQFTLYEASQMGPGPRQFDLVRTGVADISVMLLGLAPGRFPLLELLDLARVIDEGVEENVAVPATSAALELADEYLVDELAGVKLLNITVLPNPIVLTRRPVETLDGLANIRIRYPGPAHAATLDALGAVATAVQSNEMAEALARGNVDGALTGYTGIDVFKLQDSARYVLELASGGMAFAVVMSQAAYDRIPADLREAFDRHFGQQGQKSWGQLLAIGEVQAREVLSDVLEIRQLSEEDTARFREIADRLRDEAVSRRDADGKPATEFLEALARRSEAYR